MEINIYKLAVEKQACIELLTEKEMSRFGNEQKREIGIIVNDEERNTEFTVDFFYKIQTDETDIEWMKYWKTFFENNEELKKNIESSFGMILIEFNATLYAISYGRAHSFATGMADMEFGFDIAEVIHDETSIDVKAARFFKQSKNKSLTQYNANSVVAYEIGESNELLISKIVLKDKYSHFQLYQYKDNMKFGTSVKFEVNKYQPDDLIKIVFELNYLLENEEKNGSLPRMNFLKNNADNAPIIADLSSRLFDALMSNDPSISLSYYIEDDGDIRITPSIDSQVELVFSRAIPVESYSIEAISKALKDKITASDISRVSVRPKGDNGKQINLLKILDFNVEYNCKDYCLYKGKWASFNKSYVEYIEREIVRVNEIARYLDIFDLHEDVLIEGRRIQQEKPTEYDSEAGYTEYLYNIYIHNKFDYTLLDRKRDHQMFKNVEFADLYNAKEASLIHVKIGDTSSLRYCIQQSVHSVELLNTQSTILDVYGIEKIKTISMLFVVQSQNIFESEGSINFLKNKSIYFHIEIIDWLIKVQSLGFKPEIIIAIDKR